MRVFVTGGTGFIGGFVARKLRERGDDVAALVRSPDRARELARLGCELVEGDLSDAAAIRRGVQGCEAVIHGAALFKVGLPKSQQGAMWDANVGGSERVFDAAVEAGVARIVYVSTVMVFGNTHGQVIDESYRRPADEPFMSYYEKTKHRSHQVALDRIAAGALIAMVMPGGVYGPGDQSDLATMIEQARSGKLKAKVFPEFGGTFVHVEDAAEGILLALDRGEVGEAYLLGGERSTLGTLLDSAATLSGRKPTRMTLPGAALAAMAPLGPVVGPLMGFPPNMREAIRSTRDTTYWCRDDKAQEHLGYRGRDLETGLRDTLAALG